MRSIKISFAQIDWYILLTIIFLLLFSFSAVYSSSAAFADAKFGMVDFFFQNHFRNVFLTIVIIFVVSFINYKFWSNIIKPILWLVFLLLVAVLIVGSSAKGANRWIEIGLFNFQPSELVKLALVIYISKIFEERRDFINDFKFVAFPIYFWTVVYLLLIVLQPNFSTAIVVFLIVVSILLVSNLPKKFVFSFSLVSLFIGAIIGVSAQYRMLRILAFFNEIEGRNQVLYQINQALIALGNGGFFGLGPGHSRQSQLFLPEAYGDFIFSIIGEEYGFVGTLLIIGLFTLVLIRVYIIAKLCPDNFSFFITVGTFFSLAYFFIVNVAVNIGLLPTTGLPMPFVSYGGTALLVYGILIGIVLNISKKRPYP